MPGTTGVQVVEFCKKSEELRNVPFIMISAERDKAKVFQALKAGVLDYIVKPFSPPLLLEKLQRIKSGKRAKTA